MALLALLVTAPDVIAQQNMPQASQVNGMPLNTPELAVGTVTVRLFRERIGNNIPNHQVTLQTPGGLRTANTDGQGRVEFSGLTPGQTIRVRAEVDGEALESQEFPVAAQGGTRVALIAGIAAAAAREKAEAEEMARQPAVPGVVVLGNQSRVIVEFQDDDLTVFYVLDILNAARSPIDTGKPLEFEMPKEARDTTLLEGSSQLASMRRGKLVVTGPFPPGSTPVQVAFKLPWYGTSLQINQTWPIAMDDVFVAIEKVGGLTLSSPQVAQQQDGQASGQTFVMGIGPRLNPGQPLSLTIGGLPNRSTWTRTAGLVTAGVILLFGAFAAWRGGEVRESRIESAGSQREALFNELVELERKHARGGIDDETFRDRRTALVVEIEHVMTEMERRAVRPSPAGREGAPA